jgi:hypothetical protein
VALLRQRYASKPADQPRTTLEKTFQAVTIFRGARLAILTMSQRMYGERHA